MQGLKPPVSTTPAVRFDDPAREDCTNRPIMPQLVRHPWMGVRFAWGGVNAGPSLLSMNAPSSWGKTPRQSIEEECANRGKDAVVAGCIQLLDGGDVDAELILALGGPPARWVLTGEPSGPPYWLRVWALRGLLWVWDGAATPSVVAALHDDAWRVREMALKVLHRHGPEITLSTVADLQEDPMARVRVAASRALIRLIKTGQ